MGGSNVVKGQCSGASLPFGGQNACPGSIISYTIQNMPANYTIQWSVGTYGNILSGQGTPTLTVQWNFPINCSNCSNYDFEVAVNLMEINGYCWDYLTTIQQRGWGGPAPGINGSSNPHAGDTCWYMAEYFESINSYPVGAFQNVQGGTVIGNYYNFSMGNGAVSWAIQRYIQVVWGPQGSGSMEFDYFDGIGGCGDVSTLNVTIGPAGNIDPKISGPEYVCVDDTAVYTAELHPGSSYLWQVNGGIILSGQGTPQVEVGYNWVNMPHHDSRSSIMLYETNNGQSASIHKQVGHDPGGTGGLDIVYGPDSVCNNGQARYYASAKSANYAWNVTGGALVSGQGTDTVTVQWPFFGSGTGTVEVTASGTCYTVTRNKNVWYGGGFANYPQLLAAGSANLGTTVTYSTPSNAGHSYNWSVSAGGTILSGQGTNVIQVQWNQPGAQTVTIQENGPGCGTLTQTANINVIGFEVEVSANDSSLQVGYGPQQCATLTPTTMPTATNPSYVWSTGATTPTISVCPTTMTTYSVTVTDPTLGTATDDIVIEVEDLSCGSGGVKICRNLGIFTFTQCVSPLMVPTYLSQGSTLGTCPAKAPWNETRAYAFEVTPNPARDRGEVLLAVSMKGSYAVELLDLEGRKIRTIFRGEMEEGEMKEVVVEREELAAGIYLLRLRGPGISEVKKWTFL